MFVARVANGNARSIEVRAALAPAWCKPNALRRKPCIRSDGGAVRPPKARDYRADEANRATCGS